MFADLPTSFSAVRHALGVKLFTVTLTATPSSQNRTWERFLMTSYCSTCQRELCGFISFHYYKLRKPTSSTFNSDSSDLRFFPSTESYIWILSLVTSFGYLFSKFYLSYTFRA